MATKAKVHRASAQRRRAALLEAAADLAAEVGAGSVTHRAVAARAGVPLSTTSYFFDSIDELVTEALHVGAAERVSDFDAAERIAVLGDGSADDRLEGAADQLLGASRTTQAGVVEYYLAAGRQPELRGDVSATVRRLTERIEGHLDRAGAPQAAEAAAAMVTLADGATLHKLAKLDVDHKARLAGALRMVLAAAMLTDDETDALLARYQPT